MPTKREMTRSPRGHYGVVVHNPKHEVNVGSLYRSAFLYGASFVGTVGKRYEKQPSDTPNTAARMPLIHYRDIDDMHEHLPYAAPLIGIELTDDAVPLNHFWHPPNAVYLFGAEDHGLPQKVLDRCHKTVQIPAPKEWSMNVAVAGGIVLWDRYSQSLR